MTRLQRWLAAGNWLAAIAGAVLTAPDHLWFRGALAAVLVGFAGTAVWRWTTAARRWWAVASLGCATLGAIAYIGSFAAEAVCTARNASGQRVVIGTEFTARGQQYHQQNPNEDNNDILEALAGLPRSEVWTLESIQRCGLRLMLTGGLWMPLFGSALMCAFGLLTPVPGAPRLRDGKKRVFISYNHEDAQVAARIRESLARKKLEVIIDVDKMTAGQRIQEFIEQSIRESDAVVSILSNRSLQSGWVALETISSFERGKWVDGKLFVGCYLDDDFFRPEFRLECTRKIDTRLEELERLIEEYAERKLDPVDLNEEKTRLYELRNNLGAILATLKGSLCLDLRGEHFDASMRRLIEAIEKV